jgi:hypothetical protein
VDTIAAYITSANYVDKKWKFLSSFE